MAEELTIRMEPLRDAEDIVVTVTQEAESLNPLLVPVATSYKELKRSVSSSVTHTHTHSNIELQPTYVLR